MNWNDDELAAWRANPMTCALMAAVQKAHKMRMHACMNAAWAGNPWPEAQRLALQGEMRTFDDLFSASAADFVKIMETEIE